ncbi:MAG: hypothetical protein IPN29_01945 [Saprospiraceae bacterium]|nr:hypothetical protein [Saprospiraceae bacterium]
MMDNNEYFALFYSIVQNKDCENLNRVAFDEAEGVHWGMYGCHKYNNYGAFRTAKTRYIRRLMVKKTRCYTSS